MTLFETRPADGSAAQPSPSQPSMAPPAASGPPRRPTKPPLTPSEAKRLGRRLFWWSLPFVAAAVFFGVKFVSLPVVAQSAIASYESGAHADSIASAGHLQTVNVVERYLASFDRGTAAAVGRNWVLATDDLAKALELAPDEASSCIVRVNLARAYETQGDEYVKGGFFQGGINLYETAKKIVDGGAACFPPQDEQDQQQDQNQQGQDESGQIDPKATPGENLKDTGDRLDRKSRSATEQRDGTQQGQNGQQNQGGQQNQNGQDGQNGQNDQPGSGQPQPGSGSSGTGDPGLDGKVDRLKDSGQEAEQGKSTEDAKGRGRQSGNGTGGFTERPW